MKRLLAILFLSASSFGASYVAPPVYDTLATLTNSTAYTHVPLAWVQAPSTGEPALFYTYSASDTNAVNSPWVLPAKGGGRWLSYQVPSAWIVGGGGGSVAWVDITGKPTFGDLALEDWPASDGQEYVAKNGAWAVATGGGGGGTSVFVDGASVSNPNWISSADITNVITSVTNIAPTIRAASVSTNKIDATFFAWVDSMDAPIPATSISDSTTAGRNLLTAADVAAQRTALGLGTAATNNVPATGNAASGEVVLGSDTRLSKTAGRWTATQGEPPASNYATFSTRNSIGTLLFDHTTSESIRFKWLVPEGFTNTTANVYVKWTTSATSGDGRWGARMWALTGDIDSDSFDTAVEATTTTSATAGTVMTTTLSTVGTDSASAGDWVYVEVYRDAADAADTINSNDLELHGVEVRAP